MVEAQGVVGLAGVPVVLAIVELVKRTMEVPARWVALISLLVGLSFNVGVAWGLLGLPFGSAVLTGLVVGLASSGLYSGSKELIRG